jgi:hypothetical protein
MDKKYFILMLLGLIFVHLTLHGQVDEQLLYRKKITNYSRMARTGNTLIFTGVTLTAMGTGFLISFISDMNNHPEEEFLGPKFYIGAYGMGFGLDMIIGGFVLRKIGVHNVRKYQIKLGRLSTSLDISPGPNGLTLVYRF